jgi:hypothetical protein
VCRAKSMMLVLCTQSAFIGLAGSHAIGLKQKALGANHWHGHAQADTKEGTAAGGLSYAQPSSSETCTYVSHAWPRAGQRQPHRLITSSRKPKAGRMTRRIWPRYALHAIARRHNARQQKHRAGRTPSQGRRVWMDGPLMHEGFTIWPR